MKSPKLLAIPALALLALTGCSSNEAENAPYESVQSITADSASPTESNLSQRGNQEMKIGEPFQAQKDGEDVYTLNVTGIEPDFQCTNPDSANYTPNGHYVKVDLEIKTAPASVMDDVYLGNTVSPSVMWDYIDANGTKMNGFPWSDGTFSCIDQSQTIPMNVNGGENVTGSVILDIPTTKGTLVWNDNMLDKNPEWKVSQ